MVSKVADMLVMKAQTEIEIANCTTCPAAPGLDLNSDETNKALWSRVMAWTGKKYDSDVSGWDFNVSEWLMKLDAETLIKMAGAPDGCAFSNYIRNRAIVQSRKVYATSDGRMFVVPRGGIVVTGANDTAAGNTRKRNLIAYLVGCEDTLAYGDDHVGTHDNKDLMVTKMTELGFRVSDLHCVDDDNTFEFCSARFSERGAEPVNLTKGLKNLLNVDWQVDGPAQLAQFMHQYRHSDKLDWAKMVLTASGWMP
jgi:hypothetical protein